MTGNKLKPGENWSSDETKKLSRPVFGEKKGAGFIFLVLL